MAPHRFMWYILLIALIIIGDQLSKLAIDRLMELGSEIPVIDHFFSITYIHNFGAAFGILQGKGYFLIAVTLIVMAAAAVFLVVKRRSIHWTFGVAIAMIIGGGIGNLIDRSLRGYVVDFLDFKVWPPIFNVADIFVCVGCGLMLLYVIFIDGRKNGRN